MGFKSQKQKVKTHCKECGKQARPVNGDNGEAGWVLNLGADDCVCAVEDASSNLEARATECQPEPEEQTVQAEGEIKNAEPIPDLIDNRFKVLKQVGKGGMGAVYKVFDQETDTVVALKLLHQKLSEDAAALKRFEKEAEAAAQLDHPNLVPVYAHGITETGRAYLIMEYVEGKSLADVIDEEGSLLEQRAINILLQICEALSQAHEHNIIHRDIKPSNILLSRTADGEEVVRVVDFGIAKTLASDDRETRDLTQTGEVFGSPQYMSPEQCLGFMLDQRSDIYSLGCLMYETLTGKPPFAGNNAIQLVIKHMNDRPKSFAKLDGPFNALKLESITLKCLEKQQADRPQSVKEITEVLINAKTGKTTAGDYYWTTFAGSMHRTLSRDLLLIFGILMPSMALSGLYKDYSVTDISANTFAMLFCVLSFVCALFALLLKIVTKKTMVRTDAWTINSLVFSMIGFACLIPVTVSTWFEVGHRYDAVKLHLNLWWVEPVIIIGMFVSGVCGLIALISALSFGLESLMGRARKKATNRTLYSISGLSLILAVVVSATMLALPGIGDKWLMTSIVDRTADVPVELGQNMRTSMLDYIVSRVPADQPIPDKCLNAYSRLNDFPKEIALTSVSLTKPNLKKLDTSALLYRRGFAYERLNNLEAAVVDYTKACEYDPDDTYSPLRKANCLYKLGRPFAALVELDKLHVLSPDSTAAYYLEAKILQDMNNIPAALNCVDRRMALSYGRTPFAFVYKSILLEKLGRNAEAKQTLQRIKEIEDETDNYFLWKVLKAVIYKELGDSFNSRKKLESITQHDRVEALRSSAGAIDDFPNEMITKIRDILPHDDTIRVLFPRELHGTSQHVPSR